MKLAQKFDKNVLFVLSAINKRANQRLAVACFCVVALETNRSQICTNFSWSCSDLEHTSGVST